MRIASFSDAYGNTATIYKEVILPYRGATKYVEGYKLSLTADYDCDYCYHVSVHETLDEALDKMSEYSGNTWEGAVLVTDGKRKVC